MAQVPSQVAAEVGQPHAQTVGLPDIPSDISPALQTFLQGVKELLETREGQRKNSDMQRGVIVADLAAIGLYDPKSNTLGGGRDNTPPSPPRNLAVFQRGSLNLVAWTKPADADLDNVEVWVAEDSSDINKAKLRGVIKAPSEIFEHNSIKLKSSYTYWARAVDASDNKSGWATTSVVAPPGFEHVGDELYDIFFGDLTKNPGIIRIREAIQTIGAYYYETQGFYVGDVVIYGGYVYQSIKDNPAPSKPPENGAYWKRYDSLADVSVANEVRITQSEEQILLRATKAEVKADIDKVNSVMAATFAVQAAEIAARVTKTEFYPTQQLARDNAAQLTVQASLIQTKVSQTTFDLLKGDVATVSSQVDQMADSWSLKIQSMANGQKAVTGIDLTLNDGTGQSQFLVLADNFRVAANIYGAPVGLFAVSGNGVYINNTLYAPGSIQAGHLAANSVTTGTLAAGSITADKISFRAISGDKIAAGAITAGHITAGAILASHISAGAITADKIEANSIDGRVLMQNGIPIDKILTGVILQVVTGTDSVELTQPGTHIYIASATAHGTGSFAFHSSVGGQEFNVPPFFSASGETSYPSLCFSFGAAGRVNSSTAQWLPLSLNATTIDSSSILGIVVK